VTSAVLLTCHGTVESADDIPAFVANIRRGRPAPAEVVEEVRRRFLEIGGSPLMRITAEQGRALEARLGVPVAIAGRLWGPYPKDVIRDLALRGVTRLVSLPLAPQSVHVYHAVVREAAAEHPGLDVRCVPPWGLEPALIDAFEEGIREALDAQIPEGERDAAAVILSAHSLPVRVIQSGDPYEIQFRAMAGEVGKRLAPRPVAIAFQSQGMTGDAWIGPDLPATFARLVESGVRTALIAPIGFVADHVETLYDLDIEAQVLAKKAGLARLGRASALNTRPRFIDALEAIARRELDPASPAAP
jgi:ferrochelatase